MGTSPNSSQSTLFKKSDLQYFLISVLKSPWKPPTATNTSKKKKKKKNPFKIHLKNAAFLKKDPDLECSTDVQGLGFASVGSWKLNSSKLCCLLRGPVALTARIDTSFQTHLIRPRASLVFPSCFKQALLQESTPCREINICICALSFHIPIVQK